MISSANARVGLACTLLAIIISSLLLSGCAARFEDGLKDFKAAKHKVKKRREPVPNASIKTLCGSTEECARKLEEAEKEAAKNPPKPLEPPEEKPAEIPAVVPGTTIIEAKPEISPEAAKEAQGYIDSAIEALTKGMQK